MKNTNINWFESTRAIRALVIAMSYPVVPLFLVTSSLFAAQIATGTTYFQDFSVDGPAPPEYKPVGGASLMNSGGSLVVTASGAGGMQGFQLTYPATVGGQPLVVFCTEFGVDLPKLAPSAGNTVQVTFFESPDNVETTVTRNGDGTYFLRVRKNGTDKYRQDRVLLPEGFATFRFDKIGGNRVTLERVRTDGTFEAVVPPIDPPGSDAPFSSVVFTTNTNTFAIRSIKAGLHAPRLAATAVPTLSEWGMLIMAVLLLLAGWLFLKGKRASSTAALLLLLCCGPCRGQTVTTGKTGDIDLGKVAMLMGVPVPGVTVKKTISVDGAKGKVTTQCMFTNTNPDAKTFAFCNMIGLNSSFPEVATTKCCALTLFVNDKPPPTTNIQCIERKCGSRPTAPTMVQPSFHFGCIVVTVPGMANGKPGTFCPPPSVTPELDKFKNRKASDFEVTYADVIRMAGLTFDSNGTCTTCFSACTYTALEALKESIAGAWVTEHAAFKDPFIRYENGPIEYASFSNTPCTPSYFPETVPQLPRCPRGGVIPDSIKKDINLFDIHSMSATTPTPASLTFETLAPLPPGIVIETDPRPETVFNIPPVKGLFGTLTVRSPSSMPEGTRVDLLIRINDPVTGALLFPQHNSFIHDTVPPQVASPPTAFFDESRRLHAEVTTFDATTEPINAVLWFSTDRGLTWSFQEMQPQSSILEEHSTRTFKAQTGSFPAGIPVRFFFSSQDVLENVIYFGLRELTSPPAPGTTVPTLSEWGLIIMALLLLTSGAAFIRRTRQAFAGAGAVEMQFREETKAPLFAIRLFVKTLGALLALVGIGVGFVTWRFGFPGAPDVGGTVISTVIVAYLVHLLTLSVRDSRMGRD